MADLTYRDKQTDAEVVFARDQAGVITGLSAKNPRSRRLRIAISNQTQRWKDEVIVPADTKTATVYELPKRAKFTLGNDKDMPDGFSLQIEY